MRHPLARRDAARCSMCVQPLQSHIPMHLTEKQKSWLNAAAMATSREGAVFKRATLRGWLTLTVDESTATAQFLQKEGLVVLLPGDEAILTDKGRQAIAAER